MIGSGSLKDGLYYLDKQPKAQGWLKKAYHTVQLDDSAAQIWLWHQRKSHGLFSLLPVFQSPTREMPCSLQLISSIECHLASLTSRDHLRYFFHLYHPLILSSLLVSLGVSALSIFMVNVGVN